MKTYNTGDSVYFRTSDGDRHWGVVAHAEGDQVHTVVYTAVENDTSVVRQVRPDRIVDLEQVGNDAAAALDRIHRQYRAKAALLSELLGRLGYYAEYDGKIEYHSEYSEDRQTESVRELVDEFTRRRDALYKA